MALNYVTLTVDVYDGQGNYPTSGTATFTPSATLTDTTNHEYIAQIPLVVTFRASGIPTVKLLATDNGTIAPSGWGWQVTFAGFAGAPAGWSFFLPFSGGAAQNLADLSPVSSVVTMAAYAQVPAGDLGGTSAAPTVVSTHLSAALPVSQGGTGLTANGTRGQVLTAGASAPVWANAPVDWLNVVTAYGADPTGVTDASAAINSAIAAAAPGQPVYVPTGTYLLAHPIVIQKDGTTLIGDHGATASGDDKTLNAGTVFTLSPTFTNPTYGAYATAAILILEHTLGASSAQTEGVRLRDFWINGTGSPASVDGITTFGNVGAYQYERIGVYNVTGNAYGSVKDVAGGGFPDGAHFYSCLAQNPGGYGFYGQWTDTEWIDCHAQGTVSDGWYITGGGDKLIGCRSDLSGGHGLTIDAAGSATNVAQTHLIGCSTARNSKNGLNVINSGATGTDWRNPVNLVGCIFDGDGTNGGVGGGGYAGVSVAGTNIVTGTWETWVMTIDVAAGCPQYGLSIATSGSAPGSPTLIRMDGGVLNYATGGADVSNGPALTTANLIISPAVVSAAGYRPSALGGYPNQVPNLNLTGVPVGRTLLSLSGTTGAVAALVEGTNSTPASAQAVYRATTADAASHAQAIRVTGDTNSRWRILGDGSMKWGPGNAGQDVGLSRSAAGLLAIDNGFSAAGLAGADLTLLTGPTGTVAHSFARTQATASGVAGGTSGTVYLVLVPLMQGTVIHNIAFVTNATVKTGGTHGWYCIADSSRIVRAATADQTDAATVWGVANTTYPLAIASAGGSAGSSYTVPSTGVYYFGVMVAETAGTMPSFYAHTAFGAANISQLTPVMCGPSTAGLTTAPATDGTVTLSAPGSDAARYFYCYAT